jgi:fermentation-respiration switch protein FrsA (DUF1100 family)
MKTLTKQLRITSILFAVLIPFIMMAQKSSDSTNLVIGTWLGKLEVQGMQLRIVFNISKNQGDTLIATMDSPDQGAKDIPTTSTKFEGRQLVIEAKAIAGVYDGKLQADDTLIDGTWGQMSMKFPLILHKQVGKFELNRPQEPHPPFPYIAEDVTFENQAAGITLAGTLTLPEGNGPFPAAIMITGSGGQNRDEELMGHKPFLVIADYLTRNGIAVLRLDDRGIGKSTGDMKNGTTADYATDSRAAFKYLQKNSKINPAKIGLIGHSEGAIIAAMMASEMPAVSFIVMLGGPAMPGEQVLLTQAVEISRASGENEKDIQEGIECNEKIYKILKKEKDNESAQEEILDTYKKCYLDSGKSPDSLNDALTMLKARMPLSAYNWLRYFILTDPADFLVKVKCPVLAMNGEKDLQVSAKENLPPMEKALKKAKNPDYTLKEMPGLNHLFQHTQTGSPTEYGQIEETFAPEALKLMGDWILKRM